MIKQVIVMRSDLKMRRGKEIAQGSHAAMSFITEQIFWQIVESESQPRPAVFNAVEQFTVKLNQEQIWWLQHGFKKVCCRVKSEEELIGVYNDALKAKLPVFIIEDEGLTEFGGEHTFTCLAIGPAHEDKIDPVTGNLELY